MKKFILSLILGVLMLPAGASAQPRPDHDRGERHGQRRDDHRGNGGGNWRDYRNYDHNRPGPGGNRYYADRYYRDGRYYRPFPITRNSRIYRGGDGRYYCRRQDGTTGLIVGAAVGGLLGNQLGDGDSGLLSTILGAGVGGALGREIDRGNVRCR